MSSCMQALSMTAIRASLPTPAGEAAMRPGNSTSGVSSGQMLCRRVAGKSLSPHRCFLTG